MHCEGDLSCPWLGKIITKSRVLKELTNASLHVDYFSYNNSRPTKLEFGSIKPSNGRVCEGSTSYTWNTRVCLH